MAGLWTGECQSTVVWHLALCLHDDIAVFRGIRIQVVDDVRLFECSPLLLHVASYRTVLSSHRVDSYSLLVALSSYALTRLVLRSLYNSLPYPNTHIDSVSSKQKEKKKDNHSSHLVQCE